MNENENENEKTIYYDKLVITLNKALKKNLKKKIAKEKKKETTKRTQTIVTTNSREEEDVYDINQY